MSKQFMITHNNYTGEDLQRIHDLFNGNADHPIHYAVVGEEVGAQGTPHLQIYVAFVSRKRIGTVRSLFPGAHVEITRGTPQQAADYCKKEGAYNEYGTFSDIPFQGKRSEFDKYKEWLLEQGSFPSDAHIAANWTGLYVRYGRKLCELRDLLYPTPPLETRDYAEGWQADLNEVLKENCPDDRKIIFVVNEEGRAGKTWFCRKFVTENDDCQLLGPGKRDDIAHAIDRTKRVFLFNIPRGGMQYLQYGILESIKDRIVFSPKYNSGLKQLLHKPHVVVFCNEEPNYEALSDDRYTIIYAEEPNV